MTTKDNGLRKWKITRTVVVAAIVTLIVLLFLTEERNTERNTTGRTEFQSCIPYQKVLSVSGCYSSKHSLTCTIQTNIGPWRTDVTEFPGSIVQTGDDVYTCKRRNPRSAVWYLTYCRNGMCS